MNIFLCGVFLILGICQLAPAFHLQGQPAVRNAVCRRAPPCCPGHVCRAFQQFDASAPRAVCALSITSRPLYAPGSRSQRRHCGGVFNAFSRMGGARSFIGRPSRRGFPLRMSGDPQNELLRRRMASRQSLTPSGILSGPEWDQRSISDVAQPMGMQWDSASAMESGFGGVTSLSGMPQVLPAGQLNTIATSFPSDPVQLDQGTVQLGQPQGPLTMSGGQNSFDSTQQQVFDNGESSMLVQGSSQGSFVPAAPVQFEQQNQFSQPAKFGQDPVLGQPGQFDQQGQLAAQPGQFDQNTQFVPQPQGQFDQQAFGTALQTGQPSGQFDQQAFGTALQTGQPSGQFDQQGQFGPQGSQGSQGQMVQGQFMQG